MGGTGLPLSSRSGTSLAIQVGFGIGRVIVGPGRRDCVAVAVGVGRRGGTSAVRDMDAEESPEVGESAGDGLDESAGPGLAVQRAVEEDDLRESLAGPVTADEPAGAGRLTDPGGHLCGAGDPGCRRRWTDIVRGRPGQHNRGHSERSSARSTTSSTGSGRDRASLLLERVRQ